MENSDQRTMLLKNTQIPCFIEALWLSNKQVKNQEQTMKFRTFRYLEDQRNFENSNKKLVFAGDKEKVEREEFLEFQKSFDKTTLPIKWLKIRRKIFLNFKFQIRHIVKINLLFCYRRI